MQSRDQGKICRSKNLDHCPGWFYTVLMRVITPCLYIGPSLAAQTAFSLTLGPEKGSGQMVSTDW